MEIPEWLVLPFFSGAVAISLDKISSNNSRLESSEKFIVRSSILGLLPSLIVLIIRDKFKLYVPFSKDVVTLINLIITSLITFLFVFFKSKKINIIQSCFGPRFTRHLV